MEKIEMSVIARRPKWEQFRDSNVLRASPEQRVLGRVDAVGSIGYWWQTAERTDVARTFQAVSYTHLTLPTSDLV